jgi:ornithine cyclodeaminase
VCCCTDSRNPVIEREWISPGTHVTSVGGTFGPEVPSDLVQASRLFVEWRGAALHAPPAGAHELQGIDADALTELGEIITGACPGRQSDDELTLYKSTGIAFEDTVVARMVYDTAVARGAGAHIDL